MNKKAIANKESFSISEEYTDRVYRERNNARVRQYTPLIIFALLTVVSCAIVPGFFTSTNLVTLLSQLPIPLVCAVGMTYILLMGSIDLSIEGVIGFTAVLLSYLVSNNASAYNLSFWAVPLVVVVSMVVGLITGVLYTKLRIPSFIVSYAMGIIVKGFATMINRGIPAKIAFQPVLDIAKNSFIGLPIFCWIAFVIFAVGCLLQKYTTFGRMIFAVGDNENVIRSAGINVDKIKVLAFVWCAFCSGVAGVFGLARLSFGDVQVGSGKLFATVTACCLGGVSLSGGKGGMLQCLMGVLIIVLLSNIMVLLSINSDYQDAIEGALVLITVAISTVRDDKLIIK